MYLGLTVKSLGLRIIIYFKKHNLGRTTVKVARTRVPDLFEYDRGCKNPGDLGDSRIHNLGCGLQGSAIKKKKMIFGCIRAKGHGL